MAAASLALAVLVGPTIGDPSGATRSEPPAPRPPSMAYVGDSIGVQAEDQIVAHVSPTRPISHLLVGNGSTVRSSRPATEEVVTAPDGPSILVVELGHADANLLYSAARMRGDIRAFLDAVAPHVDCVRWFDIRPRDTLYPNVNRKGPVFNRVLTEVAAEHPNVEVMHYSTWAALALPGHWHEDQLHVSNTGKHEIARMARQAADGCDPAATTGPFWDVADRHWASRSVAWLGAEDLVSGYANGTYRALIGSRPVPLTRGQLAAVLWRQAGSPTGLPPAPWTDVPARLRDAAAWLADQDVLRPRTGRLRPGRTVTRGELALAWWRIQGEPRHCGAVRRLTDVPRHLLRAVVCAVEQGVFTPPDSSHFGPGGPVDRGRLAHALAPPEQRGPIAPGTPLPPAVPAEHVELPAPGAEPTLVAPG